MFYKQKHFSDKENWKQILDKEFQFHRATVKKNLQGHARQLFLYSSRRNGAVENFFFLALFYIQKDPSMAKSFCGLRHCREQAHPVQWKAEEPCQEATAISGCHWWAGWPSGHRDSSSLSPWGHTGKTAFSWAPEGQGNSLRTLHKMSHWASGFALEAHAAPLQLNSSLTLFSVTKSSMFSLTWPIPWLLDRVQLLQQIN